MSDKTTPVLGGIAFAPDYKSERERTDGMPSPLAVARLERDEAEQEAQVLRVRVAGLRKLVGTLNAKLDDVYTHRCHSCGCTVPGNEVLAKRIAELETEPARAIKAAGLPDHIANHLEAIRQEIEGAWKDRVAEEREACAQAFERELEEGLVGMTFREWCEWMAARIRSGKH